MKRRKYFPIVGIGASAGGLEAFQQLFSKVPVDTGMGFVLVQHLDPTHPSMSVEILRRSTKMNIEEVTNGSKVKPNHVYVIPPNSNLNIEEGILKLSPRQLSQNLTIDLFLKSLAKSENERAIGVILSGNGSDGTEGLMAIKAEGGFTCVQDPKSAKYSGMPQSAISAGAADSILSPEEIAKELVRLAIHPYIASTNLKVTAEEGPQDLDRDLRKIFDILIRHTKVDFTDYKQSTIRRRIERRMMVHKTQNLQNYVKFLLTHQEEVSALFNDILINVTEFFRDPESFKALQKKVFPAFLKNRIPGEPIRIWVPGCSTGEEVYSIAISLVEFLDEAAGKSPIQIFATDISEKSLQKARAGYYPEDIARKISGDRLQRFFYKVAEGYKIHKSIRDLCLFSRHDVTSDPPFAKLDLISCRNILIYFTANLQKRVMPIFHYALHTGGFLWLGKAESPGEFAKLFRIIDKTHKIYLKSNMPTPLVAHFKTNRSRRGVVEPITLKAGPTKLTLDFKTDADKLILSKFAPPGVVVNSEMDILQFRGRTFPFLEPATGQPSLNLFKMIRPELLANLRRIMSSVKRENKAMSTKGIHFSTDDGYEIKVDIEILPINRSVSPKERTFLVLFKEVENMPAFGGKKVKGRVGKRNIKRQQDPKDVRIAELTQELVELKDYQQALIEQYEIAQDELTSANEELQSANEEFLSTNEETETAKEELQSTNEELVTVNDELQMRNADLTALSSDLNNLLISIDIPVLMVGRDHRIRLFSPKAKNVFNLIPTDIGRPIGDLKPNIDLNLSALVTQIAEDLTPKEIELQDHKGHWLQVQARPYRTVDNRIEGAIIALIDIDALKQKEIRTKETLEYITAVANTVSLPLAVVNNEFRFQSANRSFYKFFKPVNDLVSQNIFTFLGLQDEIYRTFRQQMIQTMSENKSFTDFEINCDVKAIGNRKILLSGGKVHWTGGDQDSVLISFVDVTKQRALEDERNHLLLREQEARSQADKANQTKDLFLANLSHELRTPLSSILTWAQLIRQQKIDADSIIRGAEVIEKSAKTQSQLIDDLLDISRIIAGKIALKMKPLDPGSVIQAAVESVSSMAEKKSIRIKVDLAKDSRLIQADPTRLQQVIWNLLTNAIKFSPEKSTVKVELKFFDENANLFAQIKVSDEGKGIPPDFLPFIFNQFSQADSASTRAHGGLGLGLSIVESLVKLQNGTVTAKNSNLEKGAIFTITFPALSGNIQLYDSEPSEKKNKTKSTPALKGLRILLVDDDDSARESMRVLLNLFGAEIHTANSVKNALQKISSVRPDVLVSDIAMPEEDGYSLIKKVRALGNSHDSSVPAIALTAYATAEDIKRVLEAGFQAHLAKPIDAHELGHRILEISRKK
ncbi:MAG: hypothetical protein A4S09_09600 [Proteobacteria bacterium SG_bin7]|nr:MAG: hypothetical protein A4S09_09600 [Proteobacteria bacterium SG_bin7]